jgi:hypothetical protein
MAAAQQAIAKYLANYVASGDPDANCPRMLLIAP